MKLRTHTLRYALLLVCAFALSIGIGRAAQAHPHLRPGCSPSTVTAIFKGLAVHYDCFGGDHIDEFLTGAQLHLAPSGGTSTYGGSTIALNLYFSASAQCHFKTGMSVVLGNPCLLIVQQGAYPGPLPAIDYGFVSGCALTGGHSALTMPILLCPGGTHADKTTGSIVLTQWSTKEGARFAFRFSPGAQLTGMVANPSSATYSTIAVPITGSASGKVD